MTIRATDRVKQFHLMSAVITPTPAPNGDLTIASAVPVFQATVIDPDNQPPYTYLWEQQPISDPAASFGSPEASSTTFGSLGDGKVYYVRLTIVNAIGTTFVRNLRIFST